MHYSYYVALAVGVIAGIGMCFDDPKTGLIVILLSFIPILNFVVSVLAVCCYIHLVVIFIAFYIHHHRHRHDL
jgi:hypothetical protein